MVLISVNRFTPAQSNIGRVELHFTVVALSGLTPVFITNTFDGDLPTGGEIIGQTIGFLTSTGLQWPVFDFTPVLTVTPETLYWIVVTSGDLTVWNNAPQTSSGYTRGASFTDVNFDLGFVTYYDDAVPEVPTPVLFVLCGLGVIVGIIIRHKVKK